MESLNICINTQTPLVQFTGPSEVANPPRRPEGREGLDGLVEGVDYRFSPGGVTRMVYPLVRKLLADRTLREAHWISLNPRAPGTVCLPGITLHNVSLGKRRMRSYGKVKEAIWGAIHGLAGSSSQEDLFWTDDFSEYAYYNRITAETIRKLDRTYDFDLFYIHDFQQLPIGHMLNTLKPKIFRWHIPFDDSVIPEQWKPLMGTYLNGYDIVVVSTDRYLSALDALGFKGRALREYPYVDPRDFSLPTPAEAQTAVAPYGVREDDQVALVVARLDPSKGQDRAIRALAQLARRHPRLKMVFVGNGSFSSSGSGLGLSKSALWKEKLEELAAGLDVRDRVLFTGHVPQRDLDSFYERSQFTILPSVREGFGLVVVEGWLHRKPTVVTARAGVTELIRDGWNGLLFDPERPETLADKMEVLLADGGELGGKLGQNGYRTSEKCTLEVAAKAEAALVQEAVEA